MVKKYIPSDIEKKWQQKWSEDNLYATNLQDKGDPYYVLTEFTYPSGDLHMGHWYAFVLPDIYARFKRMQGYNVFLPNGFDAFGLPAENAAIKRGIHPRDWTYANMDRMREQFATMGASYQWKEGVVTCDPSYYRWNQWIFLKMLEKGLAYKGKLLSNWCPKCQTVLANENVEAGHCWRCGSEVEQKEVEQWFLKITDYADKLIWSDPPSVDWPKALREGQNNWIGKSAGIVINFDNLQVFTTRPDTLFGVTFISVSPEHQLLKALINPEESEKVEEYIAEAKKKSELERKENKDKTGVFTGSYVNHPLTNEKIPVWVADYVLPGYGTGAVMGVPAHDQRDFEFAKKFDLPIKQVIIPSGEAIADREELRTYTGEGVLVDSGDYSGMQSAQARQKVSKYIVKHKLGSIKTEYHLHDWSISRQRYWGTPIPVIYCEDCGMVPVPEKDLPVELPYQVDYAPQGKPPLATAKEWVNVACPRCQKMAKREAETMDTFIDSSWYFLRYLDDQNDQQIFDPEKIKDWMPLKIYFGGAEHTLGHTLYSRFFTKFFLDLGLISFDEYALKRFNRGLILGPDGQKMSKSKGNVINPDEQVQKVGADTVRVYLAFLGPYDSIASWNESAVFGLYHFIERIWALSERVSDTLEVNAKSYSLMHKTIKKVTEDIDKLKFNTAVASLMEWLNTFKAGISLEEYKTLLLLLAPFAPHVTEELWSQLDLGYSIHQQAWPKVEANYLTEDQLQIVVSVNGKVRDSLLIPKDIVNSQKDIENMALSSPKVQKFLDKAAPKKIIYVPGKILNFVV